MSRPALILLFVSSVLLEIRAAPSARLDIGLYAIDNYDGNGNIMCDLIYQGLSAENFYNIAAATVPLPPGGSPATHQEFWRVDSQVTKAAMTSYVDPKHPGILERERAHLVFYSGHGFRAGLFLGGNYSKYGSVRDNDLKLGLPADGANRWFIANSCLMFGHAVPPPLAMLEAFKGLKAMLGFKSMIYDLPESHALWTDFWHRWTTHQSLITAFFSAHSGLVYNGLYPGPGVHPGCQSAPPDNPNGFDYCRQSYHDSNLNKAAPTTGDFYDTKYGSPNY